MDNLLVICIDRDNDLGKKASIKGPVIGREKNLEAASKLALADPTESDANNMFAAVKKFDELVKKVKTVEIATLTGHSKASFESDLEINRQLDELMKTFKPDGFVLVTDGAEDDQVIPILQSRAKIVSKEVVIIKQAQQIESAFFTLKEVVKDPYIARIVFGIPAIGILLFAFFETLGLQIILLVSGIYLLFKGFGLEEPIISAFRGVTGSISGQRTSSPFYVGSILIVIIGIWAAYSNYLSAQINDILLDSLEIAQSVYIFFVLAAISVAIGRAIDAVHFKKAFLLRKYFLTSVSILIFWWILDAATRVVLREADLNTFLVTILGSFLILLVCFRLSEVFDVREKITKLLIGLPIYSSNGTWLGRVTAIDKKKKSLTYLKSSSSESVEVSKKNFSLKKGKVTLGA